MIKEVVADRRMPPWHADPRYGKFANDRSLKSAERDTLLAWIEQGCPPGEVRDAPPVETASEGWSIGTPDVVLSMPKTYTVPAKAPKGGLPYQYFFVPTNFKEDTWVRAVAARPGNRSVVHHIIVYVMMDKKRIGPGDGIGRGLLVAYAPGDLGAVYPEGSAKKIPRGASLVFQMHYTPNGTEQSDCSSVGLIFSREAPKHEIASRAIAQQWLMIWPGLDHQRFTASSTFKDDVLVWNRLPHMHLRGKSFRYELERPGEPRETLLEVPRYDFGWQASYRLEKPLEVPAGSKIHCTATFDNSAGNLNNPDPTKLVRWGDQTWEEMMIGFVEYSLVRKSGS
jgi:hypothetical protein